MGYGIYPRLFPVLDSTQFYCLLACLTYAAHTYHDWIAVPFSTLTDHCGYNGSLGFTEKYLHQLFIGRHEQLAATVSICCCRPMFLKTECALNTITCSSLLTITGKSFPSLQHSPQMRIGCHPAPNRLISAASTWRLRNRRFSLRINVARYGYCVIVFGFVIVASNLCKNVFFVPDFCMGA